MIPISPSNQLAGSVLPHDPLSTAVTLTDWSDTSTHRHTDTDLGAQVLFKLSPMSPRDETLSLYNHWLIELQQQVEAAGFHIADGVIALMGDRPSLFQFIMVWPSRGAAAEWSPAASMNTPWLIHIGRGSQIISISSILKKKNPMLRLSLKQGATLSTLLLWRLAAVEALFFFPSCIKTKFRQKNAWWW